MREPRLRRKPTGPCYTLAPMLDDRLTSEERRALLLLLTSVALSDGKLTDAEVRFVQRHALRAGLEVSDLLREVDGHSEGALCLALARPVASRIAVIELLRLAHVDDLYAHVEREAIETLCGRLGVEPALLARMEQ